MTVVEIIENSDKLHKDWLNDMQERDMELQIEQEHCDHFNKAP